MVKGVATIIAKLNFSRTGKQNLNPELNSCITASNKAAIPLALANWSLVRYGFIR